jgi:putative endonuclease
MSGRVWGPLFEDRPVFKTPVKTDSRRLQTSLALRASFVSASQLTAKLVAPKRCHHRPIAKAGLSRRSDARRASARSVAKAEVQPCQKLHTPKDRGIAYIGADRLGFPTFLRYSGAHASAYELLLSIVVSSRECRFVYVLRSESTPAHYYVGLTDDPTQRIIAHNQGRSTHTSRCRSWRLHVVMEFGTADVAARFERYLKTGSGRAFARRPFEPLIGRWNQ